MMNDTRKIISAVHLREQCSGSSIKDVLTNLEELQKDVEDAVDTIEYDVSSMRKNPRTFSNVAVKELKGAASDLSTVSLMLEKCSKIMNHLSWEVQGRPIHGPR